MRTKRLWREFLGLSLCAAVALAECGCGGGASGGKTGTFFGPALPLNGGTATGYVTLNDGRLTAVGLKLGVLLVKLRTRLLGPLATLVTNSTPTRPLPRHSNSVEAAFREIDTALDHLSAALGLEPAA